MLYLHILLLQSPLASTWSLSERNGERELFDGSPGEMGGDEDDVDSRRGSAVANRAKMRFLDAFEDLSGVSGLHGGFLDTDLRSANRKRRGVALCCGLALAEGLDYSISMCPGPADAPGWLQREIQVHVRCKGANRGLHVEQIEHVVSTDARLAQKWRKVVAWTSDARLWRYVHVLKPENVRIAGVVANPRPTMRLYEL